jgi:hypothetical protein
MKWLARIKKLRLARKDYPLDRPFLTQELARYAAP